MADLYGDSEDMTSILRNLLHSSPNIVNNIENVTTPAVVDGRGPATGVVEATSSFNFSDPGDFFVAEGKESVGMTHAFSSGEFDASTSSMKRGGEFSLENKFDNFDFNSENGEGSDMGANQGQGRSSKRSRSAEIHNLSEKRRRSRINEKLKALQTLIPNSNKTDKASMLDEAIEYLKQLQLQVQMLTMRNGLTLYPAYMPGGLQPMQVPPPGLDFDDPILTSNRVPETYPNDQQQLLIHTPYDLSNQNPSNISPLMTTNPNSDTPFPMQPSTHNHNRYGLLNHLASNKELCRDDTLSRLQLDIGCSGNNSSPGVSS